MLEKPVIVAAGFTNSLLVVIASVLFRFGDIICYDIQVLKRDYTMKMVENIKFCYLLQLFKAVLCFRIFLNLKLKLRKDLVVLTKLFKISIKPPPIVTFLY